MKSNPIPKFKPNDPVILDDKENMFIANPHIHSGKVCYTIYEDKPENTFRMLVDERRLKAR